MKTWLDIATEHQEAAREIAAAALECRLALLAGDFGPDGWEVACAARMNSEDAAAESRLARLALAIDDE